MLLRFIALAWRCPYAYTLAQQELQCLTAARRHHMRRKAVLHRHYVCRAPPKPSAPCANGAGRGGGTCGSCSSWMAAKPSAPSARSRRACFFTVCMTRFSLACFFFLEAVVPCARAAGSREGRHRESGEGSRRRVGGESVGEESVGSRRSEGSLRQSSVPPSMTWLYSAAILAAHDIAGGRHEAQARRVRPDSARGFLARWATSTHPAHRSWHAGTGTHLWVHHRCTRAMSGGRGDACPALTLHPVIP